MTERDVYFTFDCVMGGIRPEVGTEVHVEASRDSERVGWKETRVQVMKEWKFDDAKHPASSADSFIGIITDIDQDSGVVDDDVTFKLSCVRFGYMRLLLLVSCLQYPLFLPSKTSILQAISNEKYVF